MSENIAIDLLNTTYPIQKKAMTVRYQRIAITFVHRVCFSDWLSHPRSGDHRCEEATWKSYREILGKRKLQMASLGCSRAWSAQEVENVS